MIGLLGQVLRPLMRHKAMMVVLVLEMSVACALVCNLLFLASLRTDRIFRDSGVDEDRLVYVQLQDREGALDGKQSELLGALRRVDGVEGVTAINQVIYGGSSWTTSLNRVAGQERPTLSTSVYMGDPHFFSVLGVQLLQGRDFRTDEVATWQDHEAAGGYSPVAIVSKEVAERMFGTESAVGQVFYSWGDKPTTVVGVFDKLARPNESTGGASEYYLTIVIPVHAPPGNYIIRTALADKDALVSRLMSAAQGTAGAEAQAGSRTISLLREGYYGSERASLLLLSVAALAVIYIAAGGLFGLLTHWIDQRQRSTGIRRALGASRRDIRLFFRLETAIISAVGVMFGILLGYALNQTLMIYYELQRMPFYYGIMAAATFMVIGQLAVAASATRAAAADPALLTKA